MRYGGRDPSRKIRGEILRRTPPRMPQDLLWRPIWCQICPKLARTGFRSQLVHFCPGPGPGYFPYIIIKYVLCIIIKYSLCIIFQYSICIIIRYSLCIIIRYSSLAFQFPFGEAAAGRRRRPVVVAGPGQGKAGMTGPGQTRPRQGTTGKPAKPKQYSGDSVQNCHFRTRSSFRSL